MYNALVAIDDTIFDNRLVNYIYSTRFWNYFRRNWHGTDLCDLDIKRGDLVIAVSGECVKDEGDLTANQTCNYQFCKHEIEYRYNGEIQKELLPRNIILKMCSQTGFDLDDHFSIAEKIKKFTTK